MSFRLAHETEVYRMFTSSFSNSTIRDIDALQIKPISFVRAVIEPYLTHLFNAGIASAEFLETIRAAKVAIILRGAMRTL